VAAVETLSAQLFEVISGSHALSRRLYRRPSREPEEKALPGLLFPCLVWFSWGSSAPFLVDSSFPEVVFFVLGFDARGLPPSVDL